MDYILGYSRYGVKLNIPENATREEMINEYIAMCGNTEEAFNHFLRHVVFYKDEIKDAEEPSEEVKKETITILPTPKPKKHLKNKKKKKRK